MKIALIIIGILVFGCAVAAILVYLKQQKIKTLEKENEDLARGQRLAEAGTENLLKYMVDAEELKEAQEDDYIEYKMAENKHQVLSDIMDRYYNSRKLSDS